MHSIAAVALFLAPCCLAAPPDDSNVRGVLYSGANGDGISFKIRSSNCIKLRAPLIGAVHSVDVTLFQACTLYYERRCEDDAEHVVLYNDEKRIENAGVEAVRCVDIDAL